MIKFQFYFLGLPAQQQFGVVLALQVAFYEIREQVFEDVGGVLQSALQSCQYERGDISPVTHGERALQLQCPYESQQENLIIHQLSELLQSLLHVGLSNPWDLYKKTHILILSRSCGRKIIM